MLYIDCCVEWKWIYINGEKTKYKVSTDGRVKNTERNNAELSLNTIDKDGYVQIGISHKAKLYVKTLHRLVAQAFIPNPNNLPQVNHKDGCKKNCSVHNLEWCTSKENNQHAHETGLHPGTPFGEDHCNAKHTNDQISYACKLLAENNHTLNEICNITKVSRHTLNEILYENGWPKIASKYNIKNFNKYERSYITDDQKANIIKLIKLGYRNVEIMKELNLPNNDRIHAVIRYYKKKL